MSEYKPRIIDSLLVRKLQGKGAVLLRGPKWCGKTTTAEQLAQSVVYMSDTQQRNQLIQLANIDPHSLLEGPAPRLIDEWQLAPMLWDAVRFEVDHRGGHGHFILTGSVDISDKEAAQKYIFHSGAGRIARLVMRTMSLWESGDSNGQVSLKSLFEKPEIIIGTNSSTLLDIAYLVCRGGWPDVLSVDKTVALEQAFDYVDTISETDISIEGNRKNPDIVKRLLRSYARHQATQTPLTMLRDDIKANERNTINEDTIGTYINTLKQLFVIEDMTAWNPNLRSKTAIRTSDTRYFIDSSIAVAALGIGPQDLINDLRLFGLLFETMCVRDLRVFSQALDGMVYHYRDADGLECDAVIHLRNGQYGLVEIKLGGDKFIDEGAKNLLTLASKIDVNKMNAPSFLMVLCGTNHYAFRREDGVYVVPITCLKD